MWEKPSYEVIDVCAEVTAYVYKDAGEVRQDRVGVTPSSSDGADVSVEESL